MGLLKVILQVRGIADPLDGGWGSFRRFWFTADNIPRDLNFRGISFKLPYSLPSIVISLC